MRSFFLLISLLLTVAACQNLLTPTEEILLMEEYKVIGLDNTGRRSLSDVWINTTPFCEGAPGTDVTCAKQLDDIQRKLNTLNPVPVPQPGTALTLPAADATVLYRRFVDTHQGEPILAVFQQLYSRILLNKYGVINGMDYTLIAHYVHQLTLSNALDFETRTHALTVLSGHLPAESYNQLLTQTIRAAQQEQVRQRVTVKRLRTELAALPAPFDPKAPKTYQSGIYRKIIARYETSPLTANLAQLRRLSSGSTVLLPWGRRT